MTTPDEPICGPSCTPDCGMGRCYLTDGPHQDPEHAHKASEQANEQALRDRIRDTIHAASPACPDYHAADCTDCTIRAHAAMAVVIQPVLDAKDAEIARLRQRVSELDMATDVLGKLLVEEEDRQCAASKRAEAAEAALATQNAENDRLDQLLIDERATTARLGRKLRDQQNRDQT